MIGLYVILGVLGALGAGRVGYKIWQNEQFKKKIRRLLKLQDQERRILADTAVELVDDIENVTAEITKLTVKTQEESERYQFEAWLAERRPGVSMVSMTKDDNSCVLTFDIDLNAVAPEDQRRFARFFLPASSNGRQQVKVELSDEREAIEQKNAVDNAAAVLYQRIENFNTSKSMK